ncbi:MAG: Gfo/Idh/MocA family oxidoreductase [Burkholderiales bacterium]|nr:Gfo/Idh/MocA family oxidoreductase [Burkholderiales bacterium]
MMPSQPRVLWAIVGCGGMARRHLRGFAMAAASALGNCELVAVCDVRRQNAELLAAEARELLGTSPAVHDDVDGMLDALQIDAVDVVTDLRSHHVVSARCLERGVHVLCEKPMAITIRACNKVIDAAASAGRMISIAENFPRFPAMRLAKALIRDGAIGTPRLVQEATVRGRDLLVQTQWRHHRVSGTVAFDSGVHNAAVMAALVGPVSSVYARTRVHEKIRRAASSTVADGRAASTWWSMHDNPGSVEATGEDAIYALMDFESGAVGQWTLDNAGHGEIAFSRRVFGSNGSIEVPPDRSGAPVRLHLDDGSIVADERLLDFAPSYRLSAFESLMFGGERVWRHDFDIAGADVRILAAQIHELSACIESGGRPEVDGHGARLQVAICLAALESGITNGPVRVSDVLDGTACRYQAGIDAAIGLAD